MSLVHQLVDEDSFAKRSKLGRRFIEMYGHMHTQAKMGYHKNPMLVIHGNPRHREDSRIEARVVTVLSDNAHDIRYTHSTDGEDYEHEFGEGVRVLLVERGKSRDVLLTHAEGKPLWRNF